MLTRLEATQSEYAPPVAREITGAVYVFSEPGDGTRYSAAIARWGEGPYASLGQCGAVTAGWLVVCGNTGRAYLLQPEGELHPAYIAEKFGLRREAARHFARLLGRALQRPVMELAGEPEED